MILAWAWIIAGAAVGFAMGFVVAISVLLEKTARDAEAKPRPNPGPHSGVYQRGIEEILGGEATEWSDGRLLIRLVGDPKPEMTTRLDEIGDDDDPGAIDPFDGAEPGHVISLRAGERPIGGVWTADPDREVVDIEPADDFNHAERDAEK